MKQPYKLTHDELTAIMAAFESKVDPSPLWQGVCKRLGVRMDTVEDAKTGDPHDFLAEPVKSAAPVAAEPSGDVRGGWTSASNAEADMLCPGRHLAQRGIPEEARGEWAETGTRIHAALAVETTDAAASLALDERETFDACREIEKDVVGQFFDAGQPEPVRKVVKRHERLWVGDRVKHSGEADVIYRAGTKALILDYKVLSGDVAASPRNMQLRDLACLVYANVPLLDSIGTAIVQPLVTRKPEICLYTKEDLERASAELVQRIIVSNKAGSPRVAGETQCKFCKARTGCAEYNRWVGTQLPVVVEPVQQALLFQVAMAQWTPEQRALAASIIPVATKRLDEIKDFLKGLLAADAAAIPGWGLSKGRVTTPVTNPQLAFDRFAALGGKLPDFLECIDVVKGRFEERVAKVTDQKGKALKATMAGIYEGIVEEKRSAPSLERVGDK